MPPRRPPLTRRELRQIGQANKTPAVRDLLWEIHRLRAIALKADQLQNRLLELGIIARLDPTTKLIAESLAAALHDEPVVLENAHARQELLPNDAHIALSVAYRSHGITRVVIPPTFQSVLDLWQRADRNPYTSFRSQDSHRMKGDVPPRVRRLNHRSESCRAPRLSDNSSAHEVATLQGSPFFGSRSCSTPVGCTLIQGRDHLERQLQLFYGSYDFF
jgi:hypothetical protein